jgi:hypothetical protein
LYPAVHVQFQIDTDATGDALVFTHDVHTVIPVRSAYVFAGQSVHPDELDADADPDADPDLFSTLITAFYIPGTRRTTTRRHKRLQI